MKNLIKVTSYTLATALVMVLSQASAFAADGNANSSLSGAQVIGGLALLLAVILVPTIKSARKAKA
ncbi:MAG TPA: hypothetical protein VGG71_04130 [Chitinophagaceae bacterium]|jgi:hypothetical protein